MTPVAPHITAFLHDHLPIQQGASQNTCDSYAYAFQLFFQFASQRLKVKPSLIKLEQIDAKLVTDFLSFLELNRGNCSSTRNTRLAAIKSFINFMEYRVPSYLGQCRSILAIPAKKTDSKLVNHLSMKEMESILNTPDIRKWDGVRDRAMFHLCFACGLRVTELITLPINGLSFDPLPIVHIMGKGRKERALPLWKQTAKDLRAWLVVRGTRPVLELFANARGQPMTRSGFEYILHKHLKRASDKLPSLKGKRVSPHVLRHTCAMMILQATGDLRKVSLWLGHENMQTTEVYLRADPLERLETVEAWSPPNLKSGRFRVADKLIASLKGEK